MSIDQIFVIWIRVSSSTQPRDVSESKGFCRAYGPSASAEHTDMAPSMFPPPSVSSGSSY